MAINLAEKYSSQIDEVMRLSALTGAAVNNDVDFLGAKSVKVYSMQTAPLNDYRASGSNRYGEPQDLQDTVQEMTMSQEKAFTFVIDKTHAVDTPEGVRDAGKALSRQIEQVIVPEIDRYRLNVMAINAGHSDFGLPSDLDAYKEFVKLNTAITDSEFPTEGRVAFCSNEFISQLKLSSSYSKNTDLAQDSIVFKGQVGVCDGVSIIGVPKPRLPAGVSFIITHPICTCAPVKIQDYKIHTDPPGYAGNLVEGLVYHDAFVFEQKKKGIAAFFGTLDTLNITMTAGEASGKGIVSVSGRMSDVKYVYKTAANVTAPALGADISTWTELPDDGVISAVSGHKLAVAVSVGGKAAAASSVITVTVAE